MVTQKRTLTVRQWIELFDHLVGELATADLHDVQREHIAESVMRQLASVIAPCRADLA
jgi:hypothetical protein